jgi:7-dehydrocholesterol reductase
MLRETGHVPVYKANGVQCYLISIVTFFVLAHFGVIRPAIVYDLFGELLSAMNVFALLFVLMLTIKGLYFPSTKDCGSSGNFVIDYYW